MRLLLALALAVGSVTASTADAQTHFAPLEGPDTPESVSRRAFAAWVAQVDQLSSPMQTGLTTMQAEWAKALARPDKMAAARDFRIAMNVVLAQIDAAEVQVQALPLPDAPLINVVAALPPARVRDDQLDAMRRVRTVLAGMPALLDAVAKRDLVAARAAIARIYGGLTAALNARAALFDALAAAADPKEFDNEMFSFQALMARTAGRLLTAAPWQTAPKVDLVLASDLEKFADKAEAGANSGSAKLEAIMTRLNASNTLAARELIPIGESCRPYFVVMREYVVFARAAAADLRRGRATLALINAEVDRLKPVRAHLDDAVRRQNAAAAK